jgi:stage II sporulation protein D
MRRPLLLALLAAGACHSPEAARAEPVVRVWLRSLGDGPFDVTGEGGVSVDGAAPVTGPVRLGAPDARLSAPGGVLRISGKAYSGEIRWTGGKAVNHVAMENYVLGVLRGEIALREVPPEAAAALAVAVRSYALHYLAERRPVFDLDDTTLYQRYLGLAHARQDAALRRGVQSTRGLALELAGRPLKAYFHSTCGGHTTDVATGLNRERPIALVPVACDHCRDGKHYRWTAQIPADAVLKAAALNGTLQSVEILDRGPGDRARNLRITSSAGSRELHASDLRTLVGGMLLRSTRLYSLRCDAAGVHVEGGGWGHGVGLCQMGAIGLAKAGKKGREIVAYYYPNARLVQAY